MPAELGTGGAADLLEAADDRTVGGFDDETASALWRTPLLAESDCIAEAACESADVGLPLDECLDPIELVTSGPASARLGIFNGRPWSCL